MNEVVGAAPSEIAAAAFVAALGELQNPSKSKTATVQHKDGGKHSYKYATLAEIEDQIRPVLLAHGLAHYQSVSAVPEGAVGVQTVVLHVSGERFCSEVLWLRAGGDPQTSGSAITYARRYQLTAFLGIAADEDDDGAAVGKSKSRESVDGSTAEATIAAPAPTRTHAPGPSRTSEGVEARQDSETYGEGATEPEGTSASSDRFLDPDEIAVLIAAFDGKKATALLRARSVFGKDINSVADLTFTQATQLIAERQSA